MIICELPGSRVIGAPRDWDQSLDGGCGSIFVLDAVDVMSGMNQMFTFYRFSPSELEALPKGGLFRLGVLGHAHPVINMTVLGPSIGQSCGAIDRWSLCDEVVEANDVPRRGPDAAETS